VEGSRGRGEGSWGRGERERDGERRERFLVLFYSLLLSSYIYGYARIGD
jgi:hypothetical protein